MGTRVMRINPEVIIGLCKHRDEKLVTACTANALPDDAHVVFGIATIALTLSSDEWEGDGGELPAPLVETFALAGVLGIDDE